MKEAFEAKNSIRVTNTPSVLEMRVGDRWMHFDASDLGVVRSLRWSLTCGRSGDLYARAYVGGGRAAQKCVRFHRLIMDAPMGLDVDHINRNTLDNRKSNLRIATRTQNLHNTDAPKHNKSGHKGVCWYPPYNKWRAYISLNRKMQTLGYFATIEDACRARKSAEVSNYV